MGFLAVLLMIQGFGSTIAQQFFGNRSFGVVGRWGADYQPYLGILVGLLGLTLLVWNERQRKTGKDG